MSSTNSGPSVTTTPNYVSQSAPAGSASVPFDPSSVAITGGAISGVSGLGPLQATYKDRRIAGKFVERPGNLRNVWAQLYALKNGTAGQQLRILETGDSTGDLKNRFLLLPIANAYGVVGAIGQDCGNYAANFVPALAGNAIAGTQSNADYTFWPTGVYYTANAGGSSLTAFGSTVNTATPGSFTITPSAFTQNGALNKGKVYLVAAPVSATAGGSVNVQFQDSVGSLCAGTGNNLTIVTNSASPSAGYGVTQTYDLMIVNFTSTGNPIAKIVITATSGAVSWVSAGAYNSNASGVLAIGNLRRDGLSYSNTVPAFNWPLVAKYVNDTAPHLITGEMRNDAGVAANLAAVPTNLSKYWTGTNSLHGLYPLSSADHLIYAPTQSPASSANATVIAAMPGNGYTPVTAGSTADAYWTLAGYFQTFAASIDGVFFDGYSAISADEIATIGGVTGSGAWMSPPYATNAAGWDGTHAPPVTQQYMVSVVLRETGLASFYGLAATFSDINATTELTTPLVNYSTIGAGGTIAGYMRAVPSFNNGLEVFTAGSITEKIVGLPVARLRIAGGDSNGYGQISLGYGPSDTTFRTSGNYNIGEYAVAVDKGNYALFFNALFTGPILRGSKLLTYDTTVSGSGTCISTFTSTDANYTDYTRYFGNEIRFAWNTTTSKVSLKFRPPGGATSLKGMTLDPSFTLNSALTGTFANGAIVAAYLCRGDESFDNNWPSSYATLLVAATASLTFSIKKNGTTIGQFTFAAAGTVATFPGSGWPGSTFAAGDVITIVAGAADATASGLLVSLGRLS